jgi:hypothetical protein
MAGTSLDKPGHDHSRLRRFSTTKKATNKGGLISIKSPDPSVLARRDRDHAIARANDGDSMNQL